MKVVFLFLTFFVLSGDVFSQLKEKEPDQWSFGANGYYGAIFRYRKGTSLVNFTNPFGVEAYANLQTTGKREWERLYKHPQIGFAFSYYNYGVPEELGKAFSLTGYIDNNLIKRSRSALRLNLGTGFVYHTKYYDPINNELNSAVGNNISFVLRGTLRYEIKLEDKMFLNLNLAFRHFSNGGLNMPNNGMNFPLVGVGLRYQPHEVRLFEPQENLKPVYNKRVRYNLKLSTGRKEVLLIDEKHPVYSIVFYASKKISPISAILVGADGIWDTSTRNEFLNNMLTPPEGPLDPKMAGITIGHELYIGNMSFVIQLARYIYQPYDLFPNFYQRYGLQYYLTKNISMSGMLVVHTRTADNIEFGMGIHL